MGAAGAAPVRLVGCPAWDDLDGLVLRMLEKMLDPARCRLVILPPALLLSEVLASIDHQEPAAVCIGALLPGVRVGTRMRDLCKRLRNRFRNLKIYVGRWTPDGTTVARSESFRKVGVDRLATSLLDMRDQLAALLPEAARQPVAQTNGAGAHV